MPVTEKTARTDAPLLERTAELEVLATAIDRASAGAGALVVIEAPAGLGKSALMVAAQAAARRRGMHVRAARGAELEAAFAFGVVRQLFESVVADADAGRRAALFAGAAALAAPLFEAPEAPPPPGGDAGFAALHGLHWLSVNLADAAPLAIAVDDAQWADESSLHFLDYLARRLDGLPVLLVVAGRPGEPGTPWAALERDPAAVVLRPPPLGRAAVAALIEQRFDAPVAEQFVAACHEATRGNPLFVAELLAAARADGVAPSAAAAAHVAAVGPRTIARFVHARLDRLGPGAAALARAVAVLGDGADRALAARLAGLDDEVAAPLADALVRAELLAATERLGFLHPVVANAIYEELAPGERQRWHGDAAALLAAAGAGPEVVAAHLLLARPEGDQDRVQTLRAAADRAAARGVPEAAARYLRRALEEPADETARAGLLCSLARWNLAAQRFPEAVAALDAALDAPAAPAVHGEAARWLARCAIVSRGGAPAAGERLESVIAQIESAEPRLALELEAELALLTLGETGPGPVAARQLERLRRRAAGDAAFDALADVIASYDAVLRGAPAAPAAAVVEAALTRGLPPEGAFLYLALRTLRLAERVEPAERWVAGVLELARKRGLTAYLGALHGERAMLALARGALADAGVDAETGLTVARDRHLIVPVLAAAAIETALERGDLDAAAAAAARVPPGDAAEDRALTAEYLISRGRLTIAQGDVEAGVAELLACGERLSARGIAAFSGWRAHAAIALAEAGDLAPARELAGAELAAARTVGAPRGLGLALRAAARAAGGDERLARLEEAVDVLSPSPARLELAHALADLGAALVRGRRRREGREALRRAVELARACGASALAERAQGELGTGGGRRARLELTGVPALTPAERRVCELASEGEVTNREIAQTLFVTEKTVELHLTSAYRKLGIRSRFQLAKALADP